MVLPTGGASKFAASKLAKDLLLLAVVCALAAWLFAVATLEVPEAMLDCGEEMSAKRVDEAEDTGGARLQGRGSSERDRQDTN